MATFLGEIKRRKVFQVAAVYAVVAWLLVQIVATVEEPLNLPDWVDTFVIVVLAIGFPVALVLSWAFDLTPESVKSAEPATDGSAGKPAVSTFANLSQVLILLAVGFLVVDQYLLSSAGPGPQFTPRTTTTFVNRYAHTITANQPVENTRWGIFAFAPSGRRFAYQTDVGIYVRDSDTLEARLVPGSENIFSSPFFSSDGRFLYYYSTGGDLVRLGVDETTPTSIVTGINPMVGASWTDDEMILYSTSEGIFRVSADSSEADLIIRRDDEHFLNGPQLLPDGDSILFSRARRPADWDEAEIVIHSLSTGEQKVLLTGGSDARYVEATGHLVFATGERLFGVALDLETRAVSGTPRELVRGLTRALATSSANYGIARDGTLAYLSRLAEPRRTLVWVDRDGTEHDIETRPGNYWYAQLSPDDSMVALNGWEGRNRRVWIHELGRATTRQLTFGPGQAVSAVWAPSGRVVYSGFGDNIFSRRPDGSGVAEILVSNTRPASIPAAFTPDGKTLLAINTDPPRSTYVIQLEDSSAPARLALAMPGSAYNPTISPDGRWLAYQSDESGKLEVYVRPYPDADAGGPWKISTGGGLLPLWSRDLQHPELFFLQPSAGRPGLFGVMAVAIEPDSGETFMHDPPALLFERTVRAPFSIFRSPYDISLDGTRFLMMKDAPPEDPISSTSEVVIVQNWFEELRQLAPPNE